MDTRPRNFSAPGSKTLSNINTEETSVIRQSKNPRAGYKSYFDKDPNAETKGYQSAPLRGRESFDSQASARSSTVASQLVNSAKNEKTPISTSKDDFGSQATHSFRANYTATNGSFSAPVGQRGSFAPLDSRGCKSENDASNSRPYAPTPENQSSIDINLSETTRGTRFVPNQDIFGTAPEEWTKQRVREKNMEWRGSHEVCGTCWQLTDLMSCLPWVPDSLKEKMRESFSFLRESGTQGRFYHSRDCN